MKSLKIISELLLLAAKEYSWLSKILLTSSIGLIVIIIFLGAGINAIYYWGFLILIPLTILNIIIYRKNISAKLLCQLRDAWGKEQVRQRNFSEIELFYRYSVSKDPKNDDSIDDQTWSDLNMSDLYSKIDRTLTNPGECILYNILRTPLFSDKILKKRHEIIKLFQTDKEIREQIQTLQDIIFIPGFSVINLNDYNTVLVECSRIYSDYTFSLYNQLIICLPDKNTITVSNSFDKIFGCNDSPGRKNSRK